MQDRFKFRFWFKDTQEMIYSEKFNDVQTLGQWLFEDRKDVVKMQCTGLKDKKCKLIYEGDVVKFKTELFGKPKQIIWNECHYILKDTFIILCDMEIKQFGLEIIGNIYENKELLNGE